MKKIKEKSEKKKATKEWECVHCLEKNPASAHKHKGGKIIQYVVNA